MKKIAAALLAALITLALVMVPASAAENKLENAAWVNFFGNNNVTSKKVNGETVYTFGGLTEAYYSAAVDVYPALNALIKGNSSITVRFSVDIMAEYADGVDKSKDLTMSMLIRAKQLHESVSTASGFKSVYKDEAFYASAGDGNISCRLTEEDFTVNGNEWTTVEATMTFKATDVNGSYWKALMLCFDRMDIYKEVKYLHVKNTALYLVDAVKGDDSVVVPTVKPTATATPDAPTGDVNLSEGEDNLPELPEGNILTSNSWMNSIGGLKTTVSKNEKDEDVYTVQGITNEYYSPKLDIYKALKAWVGDDYEESDEFTVWVVFDARVIFKAGKEDTDFGYGVKIRASGGTVAKDETTFNAIYEGSTFAYQSNNIMTSLISSEPYLYSDWSRIEMEFTFSGYDLNDEFFTEWAVCLDRMKAWNNIQALQIRNGAVFDDTYEPVGAEYNPGGEASEEGATEGATPTPVIINTPINFNKYEISFLDKGTEAPASTAVIGGADGPTGIKIKSKGLIIAAAAVLAVAIGAGAVIIIRKSKKGDK